MCEPARGRLEAPDPPEVLPRARVAPRDQLRMVLDAVLQNFVPQEDRERESLQAVRAPSGVDMVAGAEEGGDFVDDMLGVGVRVEESTRRARVERGSARHSPHLEPNRNISQLGPKRRKSFSKRIYSC